MEGQEVPMPRSAFVSGVLAVWSALAGPLAAQLAPCKVSGLDEEVRCATLSVWENRAARSGRTIDLNLVVLPAQSENPAPDPVVYLSGGPGYGSAGAASDFAELLAEVRKTRDIVLLDQRGTGRSHPLLCELPGGPDDPQGYVRELFPMPALRACLPKLAAIADLTRYTTSDFIDDLDEVRAFLGYRRINLFGGSYGTRAAQAYMRKYPANVRSAILAGVVLVDTKMPLYHARKAQESIDKLFDDCGNEEACRKAFPDLAADLASALARLKQGPVRQAVTLPETGKQVELSISESAFTTTLRAMQYNPGASRRIPLFVHLAAQGNFAPMILATIQDRTDPEWAVGLYLSITCAEDLARIDRREIPAWIADTYQGDDRLRQQLEACSFWPTAHVAADFFAPIESSLPTLILTGWLDPATPPEWAVEVARGLPNSLNVVLRDGSHGPGGLEHADCFAKLITDFLANGTPFGLDASCVKEMKRPPFYLTLEEARPGPARD
jgi:pimeloyl-ACP methyl ester carboxylesterase